MNPTTRTLRTDLAHLARKARPVARVTVWGALITGAVLIMGLDTPPIDAAPAPIPACATEDAAGPCTWNATEQGNGTGKSFTVATDGTVTPEPTTEPAPTNPAIVATETGIALTDDFTAADADDLTAALDAMLAGATS